MRVAASYLLSRTAGLPLLISQPEHPDPPGRSRATDELAGNYPASAADDERIHLRGACQAAGRGTQRGRG